MLSGDDISVNQIRLINEEKLKRDLAQYLLDILLFFLARHLLGLPKLLGSVELRLSPGLSLLQLRKAPCYRRFQ